MDDLTTRLIDLAIAIQQIPAPTFHERARAEFVRALFVDEGLADVKMDEAGNVYARLAGCPLRGPSAGSEKALIVSAHLDTVFPSSVDLHFERQSERILGPGIGDNSLGVAGLFGLVWALRRGACPGTGTTPSRAPCKSRDYLAGTGTTSSRAGTGTTSSRVPCKSRDYLAGTGTTSSRAGTGTTSPEAGLPGERSLTLPGDLWLVANVCEEGLGNLGGMRAVVDHFGSGPSRPETGTTPSRPGTGTTPSRPETGTTPSRPETGTTPLAYIVLEGMALGHIYHRGLGVRRTRVTIRTSGGHSWIDYGQPSAIHELMALATRITALPHPPCPVSRAKAGTTSQEPGLPCPVSRAKAGTTSQEPGLPRPVSCAKAGTTSQEPGLPRPVQEPGLPRGNRDYSAGTGTTTPRTTLNIGIISGGTSVNSIAAEAMLELDLRSESDERLEELAGQVEQIVHAARKPGVTVEAEMIGQRPSGELPADHALVRLAQDCLRAVGVEPQLDTGSTDANLPLSRGLPSITIGLTTGGRAHTVQEYINLAPLEKGMEQVIRLVSKVWDVL